MTTPIHSSPIYLWHHRMLGGLWALCGLVVIGNLLRHGAWSEYQQWIAVLVATAYVVTGIGFIVGRTWARRTMGVLMVMAVLLFLDMMFMFGWGGNRAGVREMLVALGVAAYTLLFLAISAAYHSGASR